MMEFLEYDRNVKQEDTETTDKTYWFGLIQECQRLKDGRAALNNTQVAIKAALNSSTVNLNNAAVAAGQLRNVDGDVTHKNILAQSYGAQTTEALQLAQFLSNEFDGQSHAAREDYENASRTHQKERWDIAKEMIALKLLEVQRPNGALNYNERMVALSERILEDFLKCTLG